MHKQFRQKPSPCFPHPAPFPNDSRDNAASPSTMTSLPDRMSSTLISPIANARQTHPANATPASGFTVLYADRSLLAVSKPPRLLSVPGRGEDKQDCLIHRVQQEFPDALIVHRIDYDTSGVLVLARGADMHRRLSRLFQDRKVEKRYIALVEGRPAPANGRIDLPLCVDWPNRPRHIVDPVNGKAALTYYQTLAYDAQGNATRLVLTPETGRTHQLRVHMQAIGHPILGDPLYAGPAALAKASRLLLHAEFLAFTHPVTHKPMRFHCPAGF